jgi:quercetin dioxygenase-like cupin family protein
LTRKEGKMTDETGAFAIRPDDREIVRNPVGGDLSFLIRKEQSNGALLAVETIAPPAEGPPLHTHTREEETIYVVSGQFRFQVGDEVSDAPAGSFAWVPRGAAHTWQNVGGDPGTLLVTFMPAGMEGFFERQSRLQEFDAEEFHAAARAHGTDVVGPPLAVSHPL